MTGLQNLFEQFRICYSTNCFWLTVPVQQVTNTECSLVTITDTSAVRAIHQDKL